MTIIRILRAVRCSYSAVKLIISFFVSLLIIAINLTIMYFKLFTDAMTIWAKVILEGALARSDEVMIIYKYEYCWPIVMVMVYPWFSYPRTLFSQDWISSVFPKILSIFFFFSLKCLQNEQFSCLFFFFFFTVEKYFVLNFFHVLKNREGSEFFFLSVRIYTAPPRRASFAMASR